VVEPRDQRAQLAECPASGWVFVHERDYTLVFDRRDAVPDTGWADDGLMAELRHERLVRFEGL
jgi:hypothetical protein